MSLKQKLMDDMKQAMREKNTVVLGAIRFLISDIRNVEIDHGEQDDAGVQKIIAKQIKQMKDAINDYEKGDRSDLVVAEQEKIDVLQVYLPTQMSDEELDTIVNEVVASSPDRNMGKIIGEVMSRVQGKADGSRVSTAVRQLLAN